MVDTDPGLGLPWTDVDDALAIVHLHAWGAPVAALTTTWGNHSLPRTTAVARALGERLGVPVHPGAAAAGDSDTEAARALLAHRGSVLALGPLTNVAAALQRGARWERLVVLGGTCSRRPNLRPLHTTELNLALDEQAAADVLPRCTDLVPMEPCRAVWFSERDLLPAPGWLREGCAHWLRTSPLRTGRRAFHPWDLLASAWVTHPSLFVAERKGVELDSCRGWRGSVRYRPGNTSVIVGVDAGGLAAAWREGLERSMLAGLGPPARL
jgi:inosine-uridine nucleoside N-ribohydrolase